MRMGKRIAGKFVVFSGLCVSLSAFGQAAQQVPNRPAMRMPAAAPTSNDTLKSVEVMPDRLVRFRRWPGWGPPRAPPRPPRASAGGGPRGDARYYS